MGLRLLFDHQRPLYDNGQQGRFDVRLHMALQSACTGQPCPERGEGRVAWVGGGGHLKMQRAEGRGHQKMRGTGGRGHVEIRSHTTNSSQNSAKILCFQQRFPYNFSSSLQK